MLELEDGRKDLVVEILDLFLLSSQLLKFKVRDLEEKRSTNLVGHFIDNQLFHGYHAMMSICQCLIFLIMELIKNNNETFWITSKLLSSPRL